jgi:hypothetical protein
MASKQTKTPKIGWGMAVRVATTFMEQKKNIMLTGMPGIGKTALAELVRKRLGYDMIKLHLCIADPTDVKGLPVWYEEKNGKKVAYFIPFGELKALIDAKVPTICFLDDFGQAPPAVQAATMQLLHGGTLNQTRISHHVRFMACTNRKQDRAGVTGMLEPVKSRFHGIFELVPELEPFLQHGIMSGWSPALIAFMRHRPEWLEGGQGGWKPEADIVNQACPRTIEHLADCIKMGFDKATNATVYAGAVGQSMAVEYCAFENLVVRMPDMDTVVSNPMGAEVPDQPDICYAMIGALHSRMNRKNLGNIYKYIDRAFSKELQLVFHYDVKKYNEDLQHTPAYIGWVAKNGDKLAN